MKTSLFSKYEFQHETVRRPPTLTRLSAEIVTVTAGGPERRIKGWPFVRIPSSQQPRILSSPLPSFDLHPLSRTRAAASDCNGAQATWGRRPWEVYGSHYDTYCTLCRISPPPPPRPSPRPSPAVQGFASARGCRIRRLKRIGGT